MDPEEEGPEDLEEEEEEDPIPFTCMPTHRMCLSCDNYSPQCECPQSMSIHRAAELGNVTMLVLLDDDGQTVDEPDVHGFTPVILAAMEGHLNVVEVLTERFHANLDWKAHMLPTDYYVRGCNALHLAAFNDYPEVCHYLISKGMDPDGLTTGQGETFRSAVTGYGMCLNDNDPEDEEFFDPDERVRLTVEEKAQRVTGLREARVTYIRNFNWSRRYPLIQTLLCGSLRWTAAQQAALNAIQVNTWASLPSIPRDTQAQNVAYLNAQVFRDCKGVLELIVSFV